MNPEEIKDNIKYKRCGTCKEVKQVIHFHKNKSKKDGFQVQCKKCHLFNITNWRIKHEVRKKEKEKEWYLNNKETKKESVKKWQKTNPDKVLKIKIKYLNKNENQKKHHLRRVFYEYFKISGIKSIMLKMYDKRCLDCNVRFSSKSKYTKCNVDHWIPVSKGGENHLDNITLLCRKCNSAKYSHLPEVFYGERYEELNNKRLLLLDKIKKEMENKNVKYEYDEQSVTINT